MGTSAVVNLALTFKAGGTMHSSAQGFDRQNASSGAVTGALPPNNFSFSFVNLIPLQAGSSTAFTVNLSTSGTISGGVTLSASAPKWFGAERIIPAKHRERPGSSFAAQAFADFGTPLAEQYLDQFEPNWRMRLKYRKEAAQRRDDYAKKAAARKSGG